MNTDLNGWFGTARLGLLWGLATLGLSVGAQTPSNPTISPAVCAELAAPAWKPSMDSCSGHVSCQAILKQMSSCKQATGFLKALSSQIGEGRSLLFFDADKSARLEDVWLALNVGLTHVALKEAKWADQIALIDEGVYKKADFLEGVDALRGHWRYWGATSQGAPDGMGNLLEIQGAGFRWIRGQFKGRATVGSADFLKFDGKFLSRQIGVFQDEKLVPNTDTLSVNEQGLMMVGRFDESLSTFEGVIEQSDKSQIRGKYQLQKGDGDIAVFGSDGKIKEKGQYRSNQLYIGERYGPGGDVIEVVNLQKVEEEKNRARKLEEEQQLAKQAQEKAALALKQDTEWRSRLEKAHAGQLFVLADDAYQAGRTDQARQALRELLQRFPDHALVAQAADLLNRINRAQHAAAAGPNVEPMPGKTETDQGKCESGLLALQKEQQGKALANSQLAPHVILKQTLGFAVQRIAWLDAQCPPNIRNQMLRQQLVKTATDASAACKALVVDEKLCSVD